MRYALIIAGGSGTRLWPMSRAGLPKQLLPLIDGKSLLQIAWERLDGLVPSDHRYICAGLSHRDAILKALPGLTEDRYLGEPVGRDTLNAVGLGAAVIGSQDSEAVIAVFTADHIIEPVDQFREIVDRGFRLAEEQPKTLVTFGVTPTHAATGYGYLQLGSEIDGHDAHLVERFKEKPDAETAELYHEAGPARYLWNSGMFVWPARTLMGCIESYAPDNHAGLIQISKAWGGGDRDLVVAEVYPELPKTSVDFAVMEPASADPDVQVAAVPMPVEWLDVGSWPAFSKTCKTDARGNALGARNHILLDSDRTLVASSDPEHLITTIGCEDLVVIHTPDATLVCRADRAEEIKKLHGQVKETFGDKYLS